MADLSTSEQLRAARAILRLEQKALSDASKVSLATIKRLEGNSWRVGRKPANSCCPPTCS